MTKKENPLCLADKVYLARYADVDGFKTMASAFGRPQKTVEAVARRMKRSGEWELYRSLSDEEYEKIVLTSERRKKYEEVI